MIFRLTDKLNRKLAAGSLPAAPLDENPYADWSARLFSVSRVQYILISHTRSFYSAVMFGRGASSESFFIERALSCLRDQMTRDGLGLIYMNYVTPASGGVRFCKALNRRVTGSMNQLEQAVWWKLESGDASPADAADYLNDYLLSDCAGEGKNYATPREAFSRLRV